MASDPFITLIRDYDMIPPGAKVLCAVSGGADSVCLLNRLYWLRLISPDPFTLVAVHFNHHLRGEESDRDEQFVRDFVFATNSKYGRCFTHDKGWIPIPPIDLIVGHGDVAAQAKARKQGIEETARQMRYEFLYETAQKIGADRIATAHNAGDNLETILLNLARGTGLQGLTGIAPRQGMLIRPLLTTTRKEIMKYLRAHNLPHVEDSTNVDETYTRNRMRRQVLPLLEEFNPALRENSIDTIRYLRADNDYLNAQAALISAQARQGSEGVSIAASAIAGAPDPLAVRAVRQLLGMTGKGSTDCSAAHLEGLVALCRGDDPSALLHLPHGLTARREYERLIITDRPVTPAPLTAFVPCEGENPVPGTGWTVVLSVPPWEGLTVRPRQTGDELTLPGRPRRSLKRLLIDRKIPRLSRDTIPVVADDEGVLAVAGLGPNTGHPRFQTVQIIPQKEENGK